MTSSICSEQDLTPHSQPTTHQRVLILSRCYGLANASCSHHSPSLKQSQGQSPCVTKEAERSVSKVTVRWWKRRRPVTKGHLREQRPVTEVTQCHWRRREGQSLQSHGVGEVNKDQSQQSHSVSDEDTADTQCQWRRQRPVMPLTQCHWWKQRPVTAVTQCLRSVS